MDYATGWLRDLPDNRDYHLKHEKVKGCQVKTKLFGDDDGKELPEKYDIGRKTMLPWIKNQGSIGSCTANAACFMYETYVRLANEQTLGEELSRLFLYKLSRKLMGVKGDTGAFLRSTMQALAMFGTCPERYKPYTTRKWDREPEPFHYAMAQNYQALMYYRLDPMGTNPEKVLDAIKVNIVSNRPCIAGFTVFENAIRFSDVSLPGAGDRAVGGHAVCFTGFDDTKQMSFGKGAFKFANSWGQQWGEDGYGWLSYGYVLEGLAVDWWTMTKAEWLELRCFG